MAHWGAGESCELDRQTGRVKALWAERAACAKARIASEPRAVQDADVLGVESGCTDLAGGVGYAEELGRDPVRKALG